MDKTHAIDTAMAHHDSWGRHQLDDSQLVHTHVSEPRWAQFWSEEMPDSQ